VIHQSHVRTLLPTHPPRALVTRAILQGGTFRAHQRAAHLLRSGLGESKGGRQAQEAIHAWLFQAHGSWPESLQTGEPFEHRLH